MIYCILDGLLSRKEKGLGNEDKPVLHAMGIIHYLSSTCIPLSTVNSISDLLFLGLGYGSLGMCLKIFPVMKELFA